MMLASELPADMKPNVGDRCFCLRGKAPQIVTITALIEGGAYLYVKHGPHAGDEFIVRPAELSYASYSDCQEWLAARVALASSQPDVVSASSRCPSPETVKAAYQPRVESQLSLFA